MPSPDATTRVLSPAAVRWAIDTLGDQRIHPTFVMYLYLRVQNRAALLEQASASDPALLRLLRLEGGPPRKPYYFPLISRGQRGGAPLASFWRSPNIPGQWAQSSLGRQQAWLVDSEGRYTLPDDHLTRALSTMLFDTRVSALAMGAYFLRNDGFVITGDPTPADVIAGFRRRFDFPMVTDREFDLLFTSDVPANPGFRWFVPQPFTVLEGGSPEDDDRIVLDGGGVQDQDGARA